MLINVYRGDCSSTAGDVSSLELYSFYSINSNPFRMIRQEDACVNSCAKFEIINLKNEDGANLCTSLAINMSSYGAKI